MRIAALLNPSAGRANVFRTGTMIKDVFHGRVVDCFTEVEELASFLWHRTSGSSTVQEAAGRTEPPILVLAAGGDGTVNHLVHRIVRPGIPVGVIPCGRANDLARELGMPCDPLEACAALRRPAFRRMDFITVNDRVLLTCGGLGLVTSAAGRADGWRRGRLQPVARALGPLCYAVAAARDVIRGDVRLRLRLDDDAAWHEAGAVVVSNQARFGGNFSVSPEADPADGLLDLCVLPAARRIAERLRICALAWRGASLDHVPGVFRRRRRSLRLETEAPCIFTGDGEPLAEARRFDITVHPGALTVAVPAVAAEGRAA